MNEVAFRPTKLVLCFVTVALASQAGEFAVLSNGFRIHADSHTADGPVIRLQTSQGVIEIQANTVASFEQEDYVAPSAAPAAVTPAPAPPLRPDAAGTGHASRRSRRSASGDCA